MEFLEIRVKKCFFFGLSYPRYISLSSSDPNIWNVLCLHTCDAPSFMELVSLPSLTSFFCHGNSHSLLFPWINVIDIPVQILHIYSQMFFSLTNTRIHE
jgi:hypothetical protein